MEYWILIFWAIAMLALVVWWYGVYPWWISPPKVMRKILANLCLLSAAGDKTSRRYLCREKLNYDFWFMAMAIFFLVLISAFVSLNTYVSGFEWSFRPVAAGLSFILVPLFLFVPIFRSSAF